LSSAEQNVKNAHDQHEQLTLAVLALRRTATLQVGIFIACVVLFILCGIGALAQTTHHSFLVVVIGMAALLLLIGAWMSFRNYTKTREKEQHADQQMEEAISHI